MSTETEEKNFHDGTQRLENTPGNDPDVPLLTSTRLNVVQQSSENPDSSSNNTGILLSAKPTAAATESGENDPLIEISVEPDDTSNRGSGNIEDTITPTGTSVFHSTPTLDPSAINNNPLSTEDENVLKYFVILRPTGPASKVLAKVSLQILI